MGSELQDQQNFLQPFMLFCIIVGHLATVPVCLETGLSACAPAVANIIADRWRRLGKKREGSAVFQTS